MTDGYETIPDVDTDNASHLLNGISISDIAFGGGTFTVTFAKSGEVVTAKLNPNTGKLEVQEDD